MLDKIAHSGTETPDTPYIRLALAGMEEVRATVEAGIAGGAISPQQLFDTNYTPLAGDKPQQYMNGLVPFADRVLRPMLDRQTAARHSKIGRASWRERGGTYGEISGVAVSLKKK